MSDKKATKIPQINFVNAVNAVNAVNTESTLLEKQKEKQKEKNHAIEVWVYIAIGQAIVMGILWMLVFLRLGSTSIFVLTALIPTFGALTVPLMVWGVMRTLMNPPAFRKARTLAFTVALIVGYFGMVPTISSPLSTENWEQEFEVILPFYGEWYTTAGGDDSKFNYHSTTPAYRWAYDFTIQKEGKNFSLDGKKNEDYFCFGAPLFSPVEGKIVQVTRSEPDNNLGEITGSPEKSAGNYVAIRVNPKVFIFLQHMQHDSIQVEIGDDVKRGQPLGACGNSGRSIEPHLQIHAQNSEDFPVSESLPLKFKGYPTMPRGESQWNAGDGETVRGAPVESEK